MWPGPPPLVDAVKLKSRGRCRALLCRPVPAERAAALADRPRDGDAAPAGERAGRGPASRAGIPCAGCPARASAAGLGADSAPARRGTAPHAGRLALTGRPEPLDVQRPRVSRRRTSRAAQPATKAGDQHEDFGACHRRRASAGSWPNKTQTLAAAPSRLALHAVTGPLRSRAPCRPRSQLVVPLAREPPERVGRSPARKATSRARNRHKSTEARIGRRARIANINQSFAAADVDALGLRIEEQVVSVTTRANVCGHASVLLRECGKPRRLTKDRKHSLRLVAQRHREVSAGAASAIVAAPSRSRDPSPRWHGHPERSSTNTSLPTELSLKAFRMSLQRDLRHFGVVAHIDDGKQSPFVDRGPPLCSFIPRHAFLSSVPAYVASEVAQIVQMAVIKLG